MQPIVFTIPFIDRDIPGYGLMLMLGFLISIYWAVRRADRSGANSDVILDVGFIALIGGIVGCRAMFVWHYSDQFFLGDGFMPTLWRIIDVSRGGMEYYGGFVLALILVLLYLRWKRVSIRWYADIIAPSAALGLAIGRIGCFLNGCCYGGACDLPWAISFPSGSPPSVVHWERGTPGAALPQQLLFEMGDTGVMYPLMRESLAATADEVAAADAREADAEKAYRDLKEQGGAAAAQVEAAKRKYIEAKRPFYDIRENMKRYEMTLAQIKALAAQHRSVPVHPTQLYSTLTALLIALSLNAIYWRRTRDGQVLCALLIVEPVTRYLIEIIRADNPLDSFGGSISQSIAIVLTLAGVLGLLALRGMPARSPRAKLFVPEESEPTKDKPATT